MTIIDSGPSRFAIWRLLRRETADEVAEHLEQLFREHGVPLEVLCDNGPCFRSQVFEAMLRRWRVKTIFRCAYRASGNGLVERSHRTIKRMAARSGGDVLNMVWYYNASPLEGVGEESCPGNRKFRYRWRWPAPATEDRRPVSGKYRVGDKVFEKPPGARCTTQWGRGVVTALSSTSHGQWR